MRAPVYPDLALSAIHRHVTGAFRVWTLCRMLDQGGSGRGCVSKSSVQGLGRNCHVKRATLYRWLAQAKAAHFLTDGGEDALYLAGIVKVAKLLKVDRITRKVGIPVKKLTAKGWRAFVFAAVHNGRPTSRQTLKALTRISCRTQARYDHQAKTKRTKTILLTDRPASQLEAVKENSTEARGNSFIVYDKKSKTRRVAHRRPDIRKPYGQPESCRPRWEINKQLSSAKIRNHSSYGIGATGTQMIFFLTHDDAVKAAKRNGRLDLPQVDAFYPVNPGKKSSKAVFYVSI